MASDKAMQIAREIYKHCTARDDFDFNVTKCAVLIDTAIAEAVREATEPMAKELYSIAFSEAQCHSTPYGKLTKEFFDKLIVDEYPALAAHRAKYGEVSHG